MTQILQFRSQFHLKISSMMITKHIRKRKKRKKANQKVLKKFQFFFLQRINLENEGKIFENIQKINEKPLIILNTVDTRNFNQDFSSSKTKNPPGLGLFFNSARSNTFHFSSSKKNCSVMSSESTHDSENVTNTLTSSNSGHLENFNNLTFLKSDLNSSGKLDSSQG